MAYEEPIRSIAYLIYVLKFFGAFPLTPIARFKIFYPIILSLFYIVIIILSFASEISTQDVGFFVNMVIVLVFSITLIGIFFTCIKNRRMIVRTMEKLIIFDKTVKNTLNIKLNYKHSLRYALLLTVIITITVLTTCLSDLLILVIKYSNISIYRWLTLTISLIVNTYYQTYISIIAFFIYERFSALNKKLIVLYKPWRESVKTSLYIVKKVQPVQSKEIKTLEMLKTIKILNQELRCLTNNVCSCFSIPILLSSLNAFFVITVQLYYLIIQGKQFLAMSFKDVNNEKEQLLQIKYYEFGFCLFNFIFTHAVQLIMVVTSFHYIQEEVSYGKNINI